MYSMTYVGDSVFISTEVQFGSFAHSHGLTIPFRFDLNKAFMSQQYGLVPSSQSELHSLISVQDVVDLVNYDNICICDTFKGL